MSDRAPLVSVIVPVHDGERFLAEALESVRAQDHRPIELIVVDDGSTDRSAEIAGSFQEATVIRQDNAGPSAARNAGIAAARGELVAFLDADDLMLPHKLTAQVRYLTEHPDVGCVLARQEVQVEAGVEPPPWLRPDRLVGDPWGIQPLSAVVRRDDLARIGGFDENLTHAEDQDLLFRLRAAGVRIEVLPEVVMVHRVHGSNMTYSLDTGREGILRSLKGRIDARRAGTSEGP